jgi:hypothetical protein
MSTEPTSGIFTIPEIVITFDTEGKPTNYQIEWGTNAGYPAIVSAEQLTALVDTLNKLTGMTDDERWMAGYEAGMTDGHRYENTRCTDLIKSETGLAAIAECEPSPAEIAEKLATLIAEEWE